MNVSVCRFLSCFAIGPVSPYVATEVSLNVATEVGSFLLLLFLFVCVCVYVCVCVRVCVVVGEGVVTG